MKSLLVAAALLTLCAAAYAQDAANSISHVRNNGFRSAAITPSSTPILATSAIFNGNSTACNITMQLNGDTTTTLWQNVQPGEVLPVQAVLVPSSGTSCTNLIALYDR